MFGRASQLLVTAAAAMMPVAAAAQDAAGVDRAPAAASVRTIDLRIASEPSVTLAGTLHLPAGGTRAYPLAVLIQGHGRNGRYGFAEIIKRLTADGTAAFVYDKRGVEQSTGTFTEDLRRLGADATAVVAALRKRPEVDGRRIILVGHSQGGVIAPAVAAADPSIAAVITIAGSVGDGMSYLSRALRDQMIARGMSAANADAVVTASTTLLQARVERRDEATVAPLRAAVVQRFEAAGLPRSQAEGALAMIDVPEAWDIDKLRSASDLAALRVPVLAIFGGKDPMVIATSEAPAARAALARNPRGEVVVLDRMSHWFQDGAVTGTQEEFATLGPNLGSPRIVALIGDWVRRVVAQP
jgi:uncharacterized protein